MSKKTSISTKPSFLIPKKYYQAIKKLSYLSKGKLFDALYLYQLEGLEPDEEDKIYPFFSFFKIQFDYDEEKWKKTCARNKQNAEKRWKNRPTSSVEGMPPHAMDTRNANKDKDIKKIKKNSQDKKTSQKPTGAEVTAMFDSLENKKTNG